MSKYCSTCMNKGTLNSECCICETTELEGKEVAIPSKYKSKDKEMVQHPSHYGGADNPYEAIKVIEAWECNFNIGTTLRYLCRCGKKTIGGSAEEMRLEDLKKARWYLDREIQNIEKSAELQIEKNAIEVLRHSSNSAQVLIKSGNPYQE